MNQKSEATNILDSDIQQGDESKPVESDSKTTIQILNSQKNELLTEPISFEFVETLSKKELFKIAIERFLENLKDSPLSHLITTVIITLMIFILSITTKSYFLISDQIHTLQLETPVRIYFKETATQDEIIKLKDKLVKENAIHSVVLKTKQDALEEFKVRMSDVASLLSGLDEINPLPNSLEISFVQSQRDVSTYQRFADNYKNLSSIDEIRYDKFLVSFVSAAMAKLSYFGLPMLFVALIAVSFIIWADSYQIVSKKRAEIEVLRLLGSTQRYIKAPFMIKSFVVALIGSIFAIVFTEYVLETLGYFQIFQNRFLALDNKDEYNSLNFAPIDISYTFGFYATIVLLVMVITLLSTNYCMNKVLKEEYK